MTTIAAERAKGSAMRRGALLGQLLVDFALPVIVYYGLRAAGVGQRWSPPVRNR
jgi:hypothetical protein